MILIDQREGSADLLPYLIRRGVDAQLVPLRSGDAAVVGEGPKGPATVGVERKRVTDLIQSLMSGRLIGHQIPAMLREYEHRWLVVEGSWRGMGEEQRVCIPRAGGWHEVQPRISAPALMGWLLTIELRAGIHIRETESVYQTVEFLDALHDWWSKPWDEHNGHLAIYAPPDPGLMTKPRLVRRWAAQLPGIGYDRAGSVDLVFDSALKMALANEEDWQKVPGIGPKIAARAVEAIREER